MAATTELTELYDEIEKLAQCDICLSSTQSSKVLPCHHLFCQTCLHQCHFTDINTGKTSQSQIKCPKCRTVHALPSGGIEDLPTDHRTNTVSDILKRYNKDKPQGIMYCTICKGTKTKEMKKANEYCITCYELLCSKCSTHHRRMSSSREHIKASLNKQSINTLRCPYHNERFVSKFCIDDTTAICNVCMHTTHKTHSVVDFVPTKLIDVASRIATCDFLDRSLRDLDKRKANLQTLRSASEVDLKKAKKAITQRMWHQLEWIQEELHKQERVLHEHIDDQYRTIQDHTSKLERLIEEATARITELREAAHKISVPLADQETLTSAEFPISKFQKRFTETDLPGGTLDWLSGAGKFSPGQSIQLGNIEQLSVQTPKFVPSEKVEASLISSWEINIINIVDLCFVDDGAPGLIFSEVKETKNGDNFKINKVNLDGSKIQLTVPIPVSSYNFCALGTNVSNTQAIVLTEGEDKSWDAVIIQRDHISCSTLTSKNICPDGQPVAIAISAMGNIILTTLEHPASCKGRTSLRCYHPEGYLLWCIDTTKHSGKTSPTDLLTPWSICTDPLDRILIADMKQGCVKIFDHNGKHLKTLHLDTCVNTSPSSVCTNNLGEIYVAFYDQKIISQFTANGQFIRHLVRPEAKPKAISADHERMVVATEDNLYMYKLDHA